eukprot:m.17280 g.17280  ORF g.17280 m.17280 type:complete len:86 (+) comp9265_c0_seq1:452-709(+)
MTAKGERGTIDLAAQHLVAVRQSSQVRVWVSVWQCGTSCLSVIWTVRRLDLHVTDANPSFHRSPDNSHPSDSQIIITPLQFLVES